MLVIVFQLTLQKTKLGAFVAVKHSTYHSDLSRPTEC